MKKKLILLILTLNFIGLVSAINIGGYYSNFDISIPLIGLIFLLFSAIINYSLMKSNFLKDKTTRLIVSFSSAGIIIFWSIKNGVSFENIFSDLGILDGVIKIAPTLVLIGIIVAMFIWNIGVVLMIFGSVFTLIGLLGSITDNVYNWQISIILGTIIFLLGLWINKKKSKGINHIDEKLSKGTAKLLIYINNVKHEIEKHEIINIGTSPGIKNIIYITNGGDIKLQWTTKIQRGIFASKKWGILKGGKSVEIKLMLKKNEGNSKEIIIMGKGTQEKKSNWRYAKIILHPTGDTREKEIGSNRKAKKREKEDLKDKYNYYSNKIKRIMQKNNYRIPKKNTSDGRLYYRYVQAMNSIENICKKEGINYKRF